MAPLPREIEERLVQRPRHKPKLLMACLRFQLAWKSRLGNATENTFTKETGLESE